MSNVKITRFQDGRAEVIAKRSDCPGCNSVFIVNDEAELNSLLETIKMGDIGMSNIREAEAEHISQGSFEVSEEDLEAAAKEEEISEPFLPVTGYATFSQKNTVVTYHFTNHTDREVKLWRHLAQGRNGGINVKPGATEARDYKVPDHAHTLWLRIGSPEGPVVFSVDRPVDAEQAISDDHAEDSSEEE